MKLLIILLAMVGAGAGALHSYQTRNLFVQAALLSEAYSLAAPVKLRVADHYFQHGIMPHDNDEVKLPPPKSIYGTTVKRVAINRGGILIVDLDDEIGRQAMTFTPSVSPVSGLLNWHCTSDSISRKLLEKLKPGCAYLPSTLESRLMHAIANSNLEEVNELLLTGAQPDAVVHGNTPLMLAAKVGDAFVVERLLKQGASVDNNALSSERRTPLMVAITSNNADVVGLLLSRGASITRRDYKGLTAHDHAIATDRRLTGERYVLMVLARQNPQFAGLPKSVNSVPTQADREARLQVLYSEFRQAAQDCHVQRLGSLLRAEHDSKRLELVDGKPLSSHIRKPDCSRILSTFLHTKESYRRSARAHLSAEIRSCNVQHIESLLIDNPALDVMQKYGQLTHFQQAITAGCTSVVASLLRQEELKEQIGSTVLIETIRQSPQDVVVVMVGILIAAGADVNAVDSEGQPALAAAISLEQPVVAKYLLDAGADVNAPTANKSYPLIEATKKGYYHLVSQLISRGAHLNQHDALGRTALLSAVARGHQRLVDSLIRAGANAMIKDHNGIDAVILAESKSYRKIHTLLTASAEF